MTINYRVGADGFLYLSDGDANLGLLDQVAALAWRKRPVLTRRSRQRRPFLTFGVMPPGRI